MSRDYVNMKIAVCKCKRRRPELHPDGRDCSFCVPLWTLLGDLDGQDQDQADL